MNRLFCLLGLVALLPLPLSGCDDSSTGGPEEAGPPAVDAGSTDPVDGGRDVPAPGKRLLWGDLHVHTNYSFDAYTFSFLNGPEEAIAFARGGAAAYPCGNDPTVSCYEQRLSLPLDFVALTEHAEYLGVAPSCGVDGSVELPALCTAFQEFVLNNIDWLVSGDAATPELVDQIGDADDSWAQLRAAVDAAYVPGEFTTLHAFEYSPLINGGMLHRNVFFLGEDVPDAVVSAFDAVDEWELFDQLDAVCPPGDEGADCEYVTIPHNPNLSDGSMFRSPLVAGEALATVEQVRQRARADVLVEVFNHKGQSECQPGFSNPLSAEEDAACTMENFKPICTGPEDDRAWCREECTTVASAEGLGFPDDCTARLDMTRDVLVEGLRLAPQYDGVNPFAFGFAGATDTHNGDPGSVEERLFRGHGGILDDGPSELLGTWECESGLDTCRPSERVWNQQAFHFNPGGLTAV